MPKGIYKTQKIRIPWNKGKTGVQVSTRKGETGLYSDSTIKKMSDSHIGKKDSDFTKEKKRNTALKNGNKPPTMYGKDNPSWKGGITPEIKKIRNSVEYEIWRNGIFAKDGYICQKTGVRGGKLVAHHILNFAQYPELRFAIDNGITLSKKSHKEFHKRYGIKNNTKEQLEEFIKKNDY